MGGNYKLIMYNSNPIPVKVAKPIVSKICEPKFEITDVYVERKETDPPSWVLVLVDSLNDTKHKYNLNFYENV